MNSSSGPTDHRQPPGWVERPSTLRVFGLLALLAAACADNHSPAPAAGARDASPAGPHLAATSSVTATGDLREYSLPTSDSGIMGPAIDHQGRVWFGEMNHNHLTVFDPRTQRFRQAAIPDGQLGIMGVAVGPDDTVWYAEAYANYVGHYFPATGRFETFPLPTISAPDPRDPSKHQALPSAPNEVAIDAHGAVWFTEMNADAIGRLDPHSGKIHHYPLAAGKSAPGLTPFGIALGPQGLVWFTEFTTERIGRLDPATGRVRYFTDPAVTVPLMKVAVDPGGAVWATSSASGFLVRLVPDTGATTPYRFASASAVDGLAITPTGQVWITIGAENIVARLDVAAGRFLSYAVPTVGGWPFGVVAAADNTVWFSEARRDKIGMLRPGR